MGAVAGLLFITRISQLYYGKDKQESSGDTIKEDELRVFEKVKSIVVDSPFCDFR